MSVKHGVTDHECIEPDCRQRPMHPETRERHWQTVHADQHHGRWADESA